MAKSVEQQKKKCIAGIVAALYISFNPVFQLCLSSFLDQSNISQVLGSMVSANLKLLVLCLCCYYCCSV